MADFVHLHNHTHYSQLDAIATPKQLIEAAKADGQPAIALTDHGVMFGIREFYNIATAEEIKPLIGMEAYVANGSRFEKKGGRKKNGEKKERNYFHLVLLAKNMEGYHNLLKLSSLAFTEGFYYKPRIDRELLEKYHKGLIATSACIGGVVNAHLIDGEEEKAWEAARFYRDLFGDDFYLELQYHHLDKDQIILRKIPEMAQELGVKMVATNDIHYMSKDHAVAHNVMLLIRDATSANSGTFDIEDLRYGTPEMYFRSEAEMKELFKDFPEAITNTLEVADKCDVKFENKLHMPEFPIPEESGAKNLEEYLELLTKQGLEKIYDKKFEDLSDEIKDRMEHELGIINGMGFPGYFLIVWDFVKAAKELGIRVGPGRGSAAGSLVAFALGITNVDPLKYDLLFERFLNPERVTMPDIDIDFADDKREKIIEYVKDQYGHDSVAMIVTFGKLLSRAVLTDVARVLGIPVGQVKEITKKIPIIRGKVMKLNKALELPDLKYLKEEKDEKLKKLLDISLILEDKVRNTGIHAAGVVIAPGEITNYVPVCVSPRQKEHSVDVTTQFSMNELEQAGLLKMDFLGLRTLSIIENTLEMIKMNHGEDIDIDQIDFNEEKTFDLLSAGDTLAVFQFESGGMQDYLRQLQPRDLEEITAMNALYRPGPMENIPEYIDRKFGRKKIKYLHPIMEKSLDKTYGIIVYQEQVMQLVRDIAGFSLGQADILRRAMGKKKQALMDAQKPVFIEGAKNNGIDEKLAKEIFDLIVKFAEYGFNKSHSLAYSYLAYQTAWLKANYTAEFLAANMTAELNSQKKIVQLIDEAKKFDIEVLPPDVNRSLGNFTVEGDKIFFGMAGIKNIGMPVVDSIVKARQEGNFASFFDFVARVDPEYINHRSLEALVCAGAFDSIEDGRRAALYEIIDSAIEYARAVHNDESDDTNNLFGSHEAVQIKEPELPQIKEWSSGKRLAKEREYLNFYISGHPLHSRYPHVNKFSTIKFNQIDSKLIGQNVMVCGIISEIDIKRNKKDQNFAIITFEDLTGKGECILWNKTYSEYQDILEKDGIFVFEGKSELNSDMLRILVEKVTPIEEAVIKYAKGYRIMLPRNDDTTEKLRKMRNEYCVEKRSKTKVLFQIYGSKKDDLRSYISYDVNIPLNDEYSMKLLKLFGSKNVSFLTD